MCVLSMCVCVYVCMCVYVCLYVCVFEGVGMHTEATGVPMNSQHAMRAHNWKILFTSSASFQE